MSYNFNHSRKDNETFDVATYGSSANGTEGDPARIHVLNANLFSTLSNSTLNEFHVTYSRETRPRTANDSPIKADTGMGFGPTFRFGNPYFLQQVPSVPAYVVAWGGFPPSQTAAARALLGKQPLTGRLPVSIPLKNTIILRGAGIMRGAVSQ